MQKKSSRYFKFDKTKNNNNKFHLPFYSQFTSLNGSLANQQSTCTFTLLTSKTERESSTKLKVIQIDISKHATKQSDASESG